MLKVVRKGIEKIKYTLAQRRLYQSRIHFYGRFLSRGDLCFDVGANMGNRVAPLLKIGAKVIAVEPQQACCEHLKKRFGKQIEIVNKGLGQAAGFQRFYISSSHTLSTFSKAWIDRMMQGRFSNENWATAIEVEVTTLDILIKEFGKPKFVKIDVEGFEVEVLSGLTHVIDHLCFEYSVPEQLAELQTCINILGSLDASTKFNYTIGEKMAFELASWVDLNEMKNLILSQRFMETGFGDVYCRGGNDTK